MHAISEIMTRNVVAVSPADSLQRASQMMKEWNVGALPVCEGRQLVGMITDRDIVVRAVAGSRATDAPVSEIMSAPAFWCFEDQRIGDALQEMSDRQIRRIPVLDRDMRMTGIVSLGDIATRYAADTSDALENISFPSEPVRQSADELRRH